MSASRSHTFVSSIAALLAASAATAQNPDPNQLLPGELIPGELMVAPARGLPAHIAHARLEALGFDILDVNDHSGLALVSVPGGSEDQVAAQLSAMPEFMIAERNGYGGGGVVSPNDTHYASQQWHLNNTGQTGGTPGADMDLERAWDITLGSPNVVVAVLDTGIDSDHPDLVGTFLGDGYDFVNEDSNPEADHPHGTWCSGCINAIPDNSFAVSGVDWFCKTLPVKVLNASNGGSTFDLIQAIDFCAARADVDILSMSLINYPGTACLSNALVNARSAGKILIACAGNGGTGNADVSWPGASDETMSIGATTHTDSRASFSGTGSKLDMVAPGADIRTTFHNSMFDTFATVSGCSFATPNTAGVAALILARFEELGAPAPTHDEMLDYLRFPAEDQVGPPGDDTIGRDNRYGWGRVNAFLSLEAVNEDFDCNNNDVWDDLDIAGGIDPDTNGNGHPDSCDGITVSCCFEADNIRTCEVMSFYACETLNGGVAGGIGVTCEQVCPEAGPCCVPDGGGGFNCFDLFPAATCAGISGAVFGGGGTNCTLSPCIVAPATGACCVDVPGCTDTCSDLTEDDCLLLADPAENIVATWLGDGSLCAACIYNAPCDWNNDGAVNSDDYFAFNNDFFAMPSDADYDGNGATNSEDYFGRNNCFFTNPPGSLDNCP